MLMSYALYVALTQPGSLVVMATLTLKNTKKLYWKELMGMGEVYGLGFDRPGYSHNTDGWLKLENGSMIQLAGAETYSDVERLRGPDYDLVLIDECASFNDAVLDYAIEDVFMPSVMGTGGAIVLAGTPGDTMAGTFFEATYPHYIDPETECPTTRNYSDPEEFWLQGADVEPLWSRHHWNQEQNVARPNLWINALRRKKAKRWSDDNPTWLHEYMGQWTPRADALVYALAAVVARDMEMGKSPRCYYKPGQGDEYNDHGLPLAHDWRYLLGVDLGWHDATAFVVLAYSETFYAMRVVYQHKQSEMTVSQVADKIHELEEEFGDFEFQVCDTGSGGKQIVESMNAEHGTDLIAASKSKKPDFQKLLNSDLWDGKLQMSEGSPLQKEMLRLKWDLKGEARTELLKKGKLKEDPKAENHLCDCLLYAFKQVIAGEDVADEDDLGDDLERPPTPDEIAEAERFRQMQRNFRNPANGGFGEQFDDSMEPESILDVGTFDVLGGVFE